jgi:hypothetical protein
MTRNEKRQSSSPSYEFISSDDEPATGNLTL